MDKWGKIKAIAEANNQPVVLGGGMAHCAIATDGVCPTLVTFIGGKPLLVEYERTDKDDSGRNATERN